MNKVIAAVDLGTTGVRCEFFSEFGKSLGSDSVEFIVEENEKGWAETPVIVFWDAFLSTFTNAYRKAGVKPDEISGIAFSQQRCTIGFADKVGNPLTNMIVWMDRRGIKYLDEIRENIDPISYYERQGIPIYQVSALSKIYWFLHNRPDIYEKTAHIWPIANFIAVKLGAENPPIDHSTASFYGLFDSTNRKWIDEHILKLGLTPEHYGQLVSPATIIGQVTNRNAAEQLGIRTGIPIIIGGGDQQCAAFGSGMFRKGRSLIVIGSASAIMASVEKPVRDPEHIIPCPCHAVPGQWEMEGHTQASGMILQKFRNELSKFEMEKASRDGRDFYDLLTEQAAASIPGARGLLFHPFFNGSQAPVNYTESSGALIGLRMSHNRGDISRALLEGICFENYWIMNQIQKSGVPIERIIISGGGSKSDLWNQIHADTFNCEITKSGVSNAAILGAALCGFYSLGCVDNLDEFVARYEQPGKVFLPNPDNTTRYQDAFNSWLKSYETLRLSGLYPALNHISE